MAKKAFEIIALQVRMREGLRRKLESAARSADHSLNSEIVGRLESSFDEEAKNLDFRGAIAALSGGGDNAQLLAMISSALHAATVFGNTDAASPDNMDAFQFALLAIIAAHSGRPWKRVSSEELFEFPDSKHRGYMIAQAVLLHHDLPPVIDMPPPDENAESSKGLSLATLGRGSYMALADLGKSNKKTPG